MLMQNLGGQTKITKVFPKWPIVTCVSRGWLQATNSGRCIMYVLGPISYSYALCSRPLERVLHTANFFHYHNYNNYHHYFH